MLAAGAITAARPGVVAPVCASAAGIHHVSVVATHADGRTVRSCVGFDQPQVNGKYVVDNSGLRPGYSTAYGESVVCALDGEPDSFPANCLDQPNYWALWTASRGAGWAYARFGLDRLNFSDGDAIGLHYIPRGGSGPPADRGAVCPPPVPPASTPPAATPSPAGSPSAHPTNPSVGQSPAAASTPADSVASSPSPGLSERPPPTPAQTSSTPPGAAAARPRPTSPDASKTVGLIAAGGVLVALVGLLALQLLSRNRG